MGLSCQAWGAGGHGRAVLARAGPMPLDKDYGSRPGRTGSEEESAQHPRRAASQCPAGISGPAAPEAPGPAALRLLPLPGSGHSTPSPRALATARAALGWGRVSAGEGAGRAGVRQVRPQGGSGPGPAGPAGGGGRQWARVHHCIAHDEKARPPQPARLGLLRRWSGSAGPQQPCRRRRLTEAGP